MTDRLGRLRPRHVGSRSRKRKIGDEITVGGPGTCAFMPRGVPHA
jgi:hypothetical protein